MDKGCWPELPAGYQLIGAYGVLLAVPGQWNPVLLRGHARGAIGSWLGRDPAPRGMLALADLRATRLEVRWRTLSDSDKAKQELEKVIRKLKRSGVAVERREVAALLLAGKPAARQVLATQGSRLYELSLPAGENDDSAAVVEWFLRSTPRQDPRGHFWSLYGCHGWAPLEARVEKLLLQPGHVEISLAYRGGKVTLGSHGLADRLLSGGQSLLEWARSLDRDRRCVGQWHVDGEGVLYTGIQVRKFCRREHHAMDFHLDARENRILWQHRQRWGAPGEQSREPVAEQGVERGP